MPAQGLVPSPQVPSALGLAARPGYPATHLSICLQQRPWQQHRRTSGCMETSRHTSKWRCKAMHTLFVSSAVATCDAFSWCCTLLQCRPPPSKSAACRVALITEDIICTMCCRAPDQMAEAKSSSAAAVGPSDVVPADATRRLVKRDLQDGTLPEEAAPVAGPAAAAAAAAREPAGAAMLCTTVAQGAEVEAAGVPSSAAGAAAAPTAQAPAPGAAAGAGHVQPRVAPPSVFAASNTTASAAGPPPASQLQHAATAAPFSTAAHAHVQQQQQQQQHIAATKVRSHSLQHTRQTQSPFGTRNRRMRGADSKQQDESRLDADRWAA
jgi:hypothetical protein